MTPIKNCIVNKDTTTNPIWLMRQAGRYLPEFREIRKNNQDFIQLCLNENLSSEITLQPIKRFGFDAAIIFSDILMLPYGMDQEVNFEKNFGPKLGDLSIDKIKRTEEKNVPSWLSPRIADEGSEDLSFSSEKNSQQVFDRLAGAWTYWGWKGNYFSSEEDARAFFDEVRYMLAMQMVAPNSPQWFNTGLLHTRPFYTRPIYTRPIYTR